MTGKKLLLAKLIYYSKLIYLFKSCSNNRLIVFNYHRLFTDTIDSQFDEGVFGSSIAQFTETMKWLKNNTEILSIDDLIDVINYKKALARPSTLITFDDGYIDNYILAYPVLNQLKIPATFFIPTSQIITRQLGWWDNIAYLIKKSRKSLISYNDDIVSLENHDAAIRLFQKNMKTRPYEETADLLLKLSEACDVSLPDIETQSKELMTWDQIREVSNHGIEIGSHTNSHRVLSTISSLEQHEEMNTSKTIIENEIGKKIRTIAYPVGNYQHFTRETMGIASECGYEAAFSYNTGINYKNDIFPYNIKRITPANNIELLAATAVLPKLFI